MVSYLPGGTRPPLPWGSEDYRKSFEVASGPQVTEDTFKLDRVAHICSASSKEAEAGGPAVGLRPPWSAQQEVSGLYGENLSPGYSGGWWGAV